jgi:hypothetical protein
VRRLPTSERARIGEYNVHNIGVSWPHDVFVGQDFKVLSAE